VKKLLIIFSALTLTICTSTILGSHEKFWSPFNQCLGRVPNESDTKKDLQTRIDENTEKIVSSINNNFNLQAPLPFTLCTKPAPFDIAKSNKNRIIFERILKHRDFYIYDFVDPNGNNNLFHIAAENGSSHIMSALFKYCKDKNIDCLPLINMINTRGKTPLGLAAACCRTKCLKMLLAHGAQHDNRHMPLLHIAASTNMRGGKKRDNAVRVICESEQFRISEKDHHGRTASDLARLCTYESTVECIKIYEKRLIDQIKRIREEPTQNSYFNLLPLPIWEQAITFLRRPEDSCAKIDQSQDVGSL